MFRNSRGWIKPAQLAKLAAAGLLVFALAACGNDGRAPVGTPAAPPGMFSTLPTTEHPAEGDQPPTIELNTPEPTPTPNPTYTPEPTSTPRPSATPGAHARTNAGTYSRRNGYPGANGSSHARSDGDSEPDSYSGNY